jgi:hypothetical protein
MLKKEEPLLIQVQQGVFLSRYSENKEGKGGSLAASKPKGTIASACERNSGVEREALKCSDIPQTTPFFRESVR